MPRLNLTVNATMMDCLLIEARLRHISVPDTLRALVMESRAYQTHLANLRKTYAKDDPSVEASAPAPYEDGTMVEDDGFEMPSQEELEQSNREHERRWRDPKNKIPPEDQA